MQYQKLAIIYKLTCANEYEIYKSKIEKIMDEHIVKYGQRISSGNIDLKPIIDIYKEDKNEWKFIQITHYLKNEKIKNGLDKILDEKPKNTLSEFVNRIGISKSEKYPYFKQDAMDLCLGINTRIINAIFNNQSLLQQFADYVFRLSSLVQNNYFNNSVNIVNELCGTIEMVTNVLILENTNQAETQLYKALINGCVLNECGYIEKLLRNIAFEESKEFAYFDQSSNTLGSLIRNYEFKVLSKGLLYYLEYYLIKENNDKMCDDEKPGKNIRNIQMHNFDTKYDNTDLFLCLELLYFILSILGDLFAICASKND